MTASKESLIFRHDPLQDAKTHIRLLKVVSVGEARPVPVHCELTTFPIDEAPPYRAISYTWGDPASVTSILVNGQQMDVRLNCEYALRQASQHLDGESGNLFSLVWIDSICINQRDNDEKGAQVAMMGEIFKAASSVIACVGPHGDDSEFLYEFVREQNERIQSLILSGALRYPDGSFRSNSKRYRMELIVWRWKHPRSTIIRLCEAMGHFLARPYFHRVWMYQELSLAKDISLHCGSEMVPISWVWVTSEILGDWLYHSTLSGTFFNARMKRRVWLKIRDTRPLLEAGANEPSLMPFNWVTRRVAKLFCEDPRDRVYGILSISTPVPGQHFQPDYTKDRMDLAVEVLRKYAGNLDYGDAEFSSLSLFALNVGLNLELEAEPSRNLIASMDLRCRSRNRQDEELDVSPKMGETSGAEPCSFLGLQIRRQGEQLAFSTQPEWSRRHGSIFRPPKMVKNIPGNRIADDVGDIHLPADARDGDWMLIPRSCLWLDITDTYCKVAFLVRHYDSEKFEVVGKVLISNVVSRWYKVFEERGTRFQFYVDYEDLVFLLSLCGWVNPWAVPKWEDTESSDAFFQTRFCGRRFSSYAVRVGT